MFYEPRKDCGQREILLMLTFKDNN